MVKQRMSSVDVAGEVACLRQRIVGMRMANLYDINAKVKKYELQLLSMQLWCQAGRHAAIHRQPA